MNEILDYDEKPSVTNYRKWAFRFFIYLLILNLVSFYKVSSFSYDAYFMHKLLLGGLVGFFLIIAILYCIIMIIKFKEPKDYKYWVPLIGTSLLLIVLIALNIF